MGQSNHRSIRPIFPVFIPSVTRGPRFTRQLHCDPLPQSPSDKVFCFFVHKKKSLCLRLGSEKLLNFNIKSQPFLLSICYYLRDAPSGPAPECPARRPAPILPFGAAAARPDFQFRDRNGPRMPGPSVRPAGGAVPGLAVRRARSTAVPGACRLHAAPPRPSRAPPPGRGSAPDCAPRADGARAHDRAHDRAHAPRALPPHALRPSPRAAPAFGARTAVPGFIPSVAQTPPRGAASPRPVKYDIETKLLAALCPPVAVVASWLTKTPHDRKRTTQCLV